MWTDKFLEYLKQSTAKQSHFEEAIALKQQHLPKHIYKYRADSKYSRENLASNTVWLASPDSYNDPYDCLLRFSASSMTAAFERALMVPFISAYGLGIPAEQIKGAMQSARPLEALGRFISSPDWAGSNPKKMAEFLSKTGPQYVQSVIDFLQAVRSIMKVCSFSAASDSILMWSHYANNHQGFCIEYSLEKFDISNAFLRNLYPVVYSNGLFDLTPWAEKLVAGEAEDLTTLFPLLGVIQKFDGWAYEREWRYVLFQESPNPERARPMPIPTRVFLGAKASSSTIEGLSAICAESHIPMWQMRMSNEKYELLADPVQG